MQKRSGGLRLRHVQSSGVIFQPLSRFTRLRFFFSSMRFCFAAADIFVGFLWTVGLRACCKKSMNRSRARALLAAWLLVFWQTTLSTPFLLMRVARWSKMRCFCSVVRLGEFVTSNLNVTRVLTLFTCCPPGPLLREAVKFSSSLGIES